MKKPDTIETEFGDVLRIIDFDKDKFIIEGSPTISSYKIELNEFQTINNMGFEVPFGVKAKHPELYIKWLKEYRDSMPSN